MLQNWAKVFERAWYFLNYFSRVSGLILGWAGADLVHISTQTFLIATWRRAAAVISGTFFQKSEQNSWKGSTKSWITLWSAYILNLVFGEKRIKVTWACRNKSFHHHINWSLHALHFHPSWTFSFRRVDDSPVHWLWRPFWPWEKRPPVGLCCCRRSGVVKS